MIALLLSVALACEHDEPVVSYDGNTFTARFCTEGGAWAGATLRRASDGFHHDVEAVATEGADEITLKAKVGPGFVEYVVATWANKANCTEGRHGCTAYGYQLDGDKESDYEASYSYPHDAYAYGIVEHGFADLKPPRVQVLDAGIGPDGVAAATQALGAASMPVVDGGVAQSPRHEVEVLYRDRWERPRAWALAARLKAAEVGVRWSVRQWAEAPEAFVVAVGTP